MTDLRLSFDPLLPWWIILAMALSAFAFFLVLELKRKQALLVPRIVALGFVFISVVALVMKPSFKTEKRSAILLTPGFIKSTVDSVLRLEPQLKILKWQDAAYPYAETLPSLQSLPNENIRYIFGEGLPGYALDLLATKKFRFFPGRLPLGIVELTVPAIFSNRKNSISGFFYAAGKSKLKLRGPLGNEDSVNLSKGKNSFSLSFRPKQPGLFIYDLIYRDSSGNQSTERLPIEVAEERALRILFVQKFPSAEVRYLKSFLADRGHSLAIRTQTSKNNFNEEFINTPKIRVSQLSSELLNSFDLVLIDFKSIDELSSVEKSILQKSVFNGLGLMVLQSEASKKSDFYSAKGEKISNDTVHLTLPGKAYVLPASPTKVNAQPSIEPVIKIKERVLAGYRFSGAGKIAFQFLQETYPIALEGNIDDYAFIWTPLIERVARKKSKELELRLIFSFPYYPNEPVTLSLVSAGRTPSVYCNGVKISAGEDAIVDDLWSVKTWAPKSGWNNVTTNDSTVLNYFVSERSEWRSLRAASQMRETSLLQDTTEIGSNAVQFEDKRISSLLFFLIFILASGFLWLAPKI